MEVGATWHNVSKILGRETELEYRLQQLEPGHIVLVGHNKTATSTDDITVRPDGERSEVTYDATVELHGLAKLGAPIMQVRQPDRGEIHDHAPCGGSSQGRRSGRVTTGPRSWPPRPERWERRGCRAGVGHGSSSVNTRSIDHPGRSVK